MDKIAKKDNLKQNVILLGLVSFLNDLSSEMILPILPRFITLLGGSSLAIGLIGGLMESISSILKVFCGYLSDKTGKRKIFVFSGYFTSSIFKLMLAFSKVWQHVLVFISFERVGKGLRTAPRDAIIADSVVEMERGKGFGIHRSLDTLGAIFGSLLTVILLWLSFKLNLIILIAAIASFLSLIPLNFVKEVKSKKQDVSLNIGLKMLPKHLKLFILVSAVFALANFSYMFFILKAQETFLNKMGVFGEIIPVLLYVLFNVFYAAFAIPFGMLSDKIGREKVIVLGYALFSITTLGFAFFDSMFAFVILFALYGIVFAIIDGNQRAFVSDLATKELRATALGTYHTTVGLLTLPSSLIAGFLWQISPTATFVFGSIVSLVSVMLFAIFIRYFKRSKMRIK
ncbi:MAG TPA: MFS transporter [Archaeoglobus veneficus]|nr:MFS transporter [Archaeoglobus veneficus]